MNLLSYLLVQIMFLRITPMAEDYNAVPIWIVHGQMDGTVQYDGWFPSGPEGE